MTDDFIPCGCTPNCPPVPEPRGGTREEAIKAYLKAAYRGAGSTAINSDEEVETGRALHPRFTEHLEVLTFVTEPTLTARQVRIIEWFARDDLLMEEIAQRLNLARSTTYRERHDAFQTLIRIIWADPTYVLPYRVYTKTPYRVALE